MHLAISTSKFNEVAFSYYLMTEENYKFIRNFFPQLDFSSPENIKDVLLYAVKDYDEQKAKIATVKAIEKKDNTIKLFFENIHTCDITCLQVKKKVYAIKCNLGWKSSKNLYSLTLTISQYNSIIFPTLNSVKHADKMELLEKFKLRKNWKDIADLFEPLCNFKDNYKDIWDNASELDKITYVLGKLTEPSDRFGKKDYYEPYFIKFNARTIELEPGNLKYQSVLAYHYYLLYQNLKNEKYFLLSKPLYESMIKGNPLDVTELYRFAKLNHFFIDANFFKKEFDNKSVAISEKYYKEAINAYNKITSEESKKWNKKNYISSLYNLVVLYLDYYLDYEKAFFDIKLFKREKSFENMMNQNKYDLLSDVKSLLEQLLVLSSFNLETNLNDMLYVKSTDKDQIDVMYRVSQLYQNLALVYKILDKTNEENYINYLKTSNYYIKKSFDLYHLRKNQNIRGVKMPFHLHPIKAMNLFFLGDINSAIESLLKGKDDSILKAAQILALEKQNNEALKILEKINDKSLLYNRAKYLKDFIKNV